MLFQVWTLHPIRTHPIFQSILQAPSIEQAYKSACNRYGSDYVLRVINIADGAMFPVY